MRQSFKPVCVVFLGTYGYVACFFRLCHVTVEVPIGLLFVSAVLPSRVHAVHTCAQETASE